VPNVRSSFVRATPHPVARLGADELAPVEEVVRAAFGQRRKTLANALRGAGFPDPSAVCAAAGIDPRARAESLAPRRSSRSRACSGGLDRREKPALHSRPARRGIASRDPHPKEPNPQS